MLSDCCTQFFICFFDLHTRENEGDDGIQSKRNHQIHDLQHIDAGIRLNDQSAVKMACCQQPAGDGSTQTAAQLHTERSAGVHRAIHALVLRQPSVLGAGCDHGVHVALPRTLTQSSDCGKEQHQGNITAAHITCHSDQCTRNRCQSIAHYIQLIHSIPLCNQGRGEHQCDDQRNVDCPREYTEQILVAKDVGCIVGAHADHGTVDLLQNVGDANHHIIFVTSQQLCSLNQIVLFVLLDFLFVGGIHQFAFRQFLHGENGEGVDKQTDDGVDDCNSAPTGSTTAQCRNSTQRDGLDEQAGGKGEHETPRTHLDLFGTVLRDESSQCRVTKFNLKEMSKTLLFLQEQKISSADELRERAAAATERYHAMGDSIKAAEARLTEIAVLKTHIINYAKTREVYATYRKAGYSKAFLEAHREEITLHKAAKAAFDEAGLQKLPKVKELDAEFAELLTKKKAAYPDYRKARNEMQELVRAQKNVERFFAEEKPAQENEQAR